MLHGLLKHALSCSKSLLFVWLSRGPRHSVASALLSELKNCCPFSSPYVMLGFVNTHSLAWCLVLFLKSRHMSF